MGRAHGSRLVVRRRGLRWVLRCRCQDALIWNTMRYQRKEKGGRRCKMQVYK